jgi:hypothetical protein
VAAGLVPSTPAGLPIIAGGAMAVALGLVLGRARRDARGGAPT